MAEPSDQVEFVVRDLGRISYADAYALQKELQAKVIAQREAASGRSMYLLLLEHDPPMITVSRRPGARRHLTATDAQLAAAGVEVAETDRGGDITCHGPGQLVAYPILDLNLLGLRIHGYMRRLEQIVIDTLARFDIDAQRDPDATGVWVKRQDVKTSKRRTEAPRAGPSPATRASDEPVPSDAAKICAMGVRITRWVSMHGLALNVTTNLDHFDLIVPCGLAGRSVTSMHQLLGPACPSMDEVKRAIAAEFRKMVVPDE
ncbi:MAG: lipoyl(octanoyl) transferase [Planctomycetota bacterium]|nr:lipoyl(octanoyl) transferase [Planctomycetota bacterium]